MKTTNPFKKDSFEKCKMLLNSFQQMYLISFIYEVIAIAIVWYKLNPTQTLDKNNMIPETAQKVQNPTSVQISTSY